MEMVREICAKVLDFGAQLSVHLGVFLIPAVILAALALVVFAKNSYSLFKIMLPLGGIVIGAACGAKLFGPVLESKFPFISDFINPFYACAIVLALILAFFCFKHHSFAVLLIGAFVGYAPIGRLAKDILLTIPYVREVAASVQPIEARAVGIAVCIVCMIGTIYLIHKYFKKIYVVVTSVGIPAIALGASAIFVCSSSPVVEYVAIAAAAAGALLGAKFCKEQFDDVDFF